MLAGHSDVAVIGLHTVFEHHAAMTEAALEAFIHEYRLTLPIAVDRRGEDGPLPQTMRRYGMRGTPTTVVIDRAGVVRERAFGQVTDLALGVLVGSLVVTPNVEPTQRERAVGGATMPVARALCHDGPDPPRGPDPADPAEPRSAGTARGSPPHHALGSGRLSEHRTFLSASPPRVFADAAACVDWPKTHRNGVTSAFPYPTGRPL